MLLAKNIPTNQSHIIKKEILYVSPSTEIGISKIYLNESKSSWVTITWLSDELLNYSTTNYQKLFNIHPIQKGRVVMYGDECESPRWHRSYIHQPKREPNQKSTYMYSGIDEFEDLTLPTPFQFFFDFLNEKESANKYNQVIANWYANGKDYIAQHSDCQKGMLYNEGIAIITLCEDEKYPRELKITPKNLKNETNDNLFAQVKIKLKHGCIITMHGDTQNNFRRGIPKDFNNLTSRISLTFRKF